MEEEGKKPTALARSLRRRETDAEYRLWYELRARRLNGYKFVRQFPIPPHIADFACRSHWLVIELDGSQHAASARETLRDQVMCRQGYSVLRFWNEEIFRARHMVLDTILAAVEGRLVADGADPSPDLRFAPATLSPQGRGMERVFAPLPDDATCFSPLWGKGGSKGRMRGSS